MAAPAAETSPDERAERFESSRKQAISSDPHVRADAARDLAVLGSADEVFAALRPLLSDADVGVRMAATSAVAGLPWRARLDVLAAKLEDEDLGIAVMAAQGLAHARDRRGLETLKGVLGERKLRFDALESLFELHETSHLPEVQRLFGAFLSSAFEKGMAALTLAREGDAKAKAHVMKHVADRKAEARPLMVVHLLESLPQEGRAYLEKLAADEGDYLRESALLALARVDASFLPRLQEAMARFAEEDPHVSGELLLALFDIDPARGALVAEAHLDAKGEFGAAARTVRLASHLRAQHPNEVLLRCA